MWFSLKFSHFKYIYFRTIYCVTWCRQWLKHIQQFCATLSINLSFPRGRRPFFTVLKSFLLKNRISWQRRGHFLSYFRPYFTAWSPMPFLTNLPGDFLTKLCPCPRAPITLAQPYPGRAIIPGGAPHQLSLPPCQPTLLQIALSIRDFWQAEWYNDQALSADAQASQDKSTPRQIAPRGRPGWHVTGVK